VLALTRALLGRKSHAAAREIEIKLLITAMNFS
jgi:hypothetical protein